MIGGIFSDGNSRESYALLSTNYKLVLSPATTHHSFHVFSIRSFGSSSQTVITSRKSFAFQHKLNPCSLALSAAIEWTRQLPTSVAPSAGETGAVFLSGKQAMAVVPFVSSNTSIIVLDKATAIVIFTSLDNSANPRVGVLFINGRN